MQCPAHSLQSHSIGATIVGALDIFYMNAPLHVYICIFLEWESSVYVYACMHGAYVISCVWRFVTSWTGAHQVPLCMGFPRQEYWKGLPFPSPVICVCVCVCVCVDIFLHYDIEWTLSFKWLGSLNIGMFHLLLVFSYSFLSSWNNILQDKHLVNLTPKACVLWRRLYFPTLGRQAGGSLGAVSCHHLHLSSGFEVRCVFLCLPKPELWLWLLGSVERGKVSGKLGTSVTNP